MTPEQQQPITLYLSYVQEDNHLCKQLENHLSSLQRQNVITSWHAHKISAGKDVAQEIDTHLQTAQLILLLVSADFIASEYYWNVEVKRAMERHDRGDARVIPLLLRPCDWQGLPFARLQVLPANAKPITSWPNVDEAFVQVMAGLRLVIEDLRKQLLLVRSSLLPLLYVPYERNLLFTGREALLNHLSQSLRAGKTTAQAITGLGGIGKTQTALEYAYRYQNDYDTILWVKADSSETLLADLVSVAHLLHLPERTEQETARIVNAVKGWLHSHQRWLLILDNADDLAVLNTLLPLPSKGHILLTTRSQATGRLAQQVDIEDMGPEEGALFLLRRAKLLGIDEPLETASVADQKAAKALVQRLGGLPLALDQAGAFIEETECGLEGYLKLFDQRQEELLKKRGKWATDHPDSVGTTWSLSFERVEQANPAAAELLRLCAFLDPDAISEEIITKGASKLGPRLRSLASDPLHLNEAIGHLLTYSLVRRQPDQTLSMHRLVQVILKATMDKQTKRRWAERAVRAVESAFPEVDYENWLRCQHYLPHAYACANLIEQWDLTFPEATALLMQTGSYLLDSAQYAQAGPLFQQALAIRERLLGDHLDTAGTLDRLATLQQDQGRYEQAEPLFQRALTIRERLLGDHLDTAVGLNNLALLYNYQGRYEEAEPLFQRALAIDERLLGEHPSTATSLTNLASLYRDQGRYEEAEPLFQRARAIRERRQQSVATPSHNDE
jgi:tetratricopeptide (TPR) repeat protein